MSSILTNTGAMIALQSLTATQAALNQTENQISTGLKVQTAKDDAASWTIATTMKSNIASLGQVSTNLGNADSVLGTAVSGANKVASLISQIRDKVIAAAGDPTTDVSATQNEVDQLMNQISATIKSSSFNGVNLLDGSVSSVLSDGTTKGVSFLAATANSYSGATATLGMSSTIEVNTSNSNITTTTGTGTAMGDLYDLVDSKGAGLAFTATTTAGTTAANSGLQGIVDAIKADPTSLDSFLNTLDNATKQVETASAQFGAVQQNIEAQQTFVKNLSDTLTSGVSNLVDADMTAASARLSALQTQQQLGTQALSIANQAPQMILKLFG